MIHRFINRCPKHWRWPLARLYFHADRALQTWPPKMLLVAAVIVPSTIMVLSWIASLLAPLVPWLCALLSISYLLMAAIAWLVQR